MQQQPVQAQQPPAAALPSQLLQPPSELLPLDASTDGAWSTAGSAGRAGSPDLFDAMLAEAGLSVPALHAGAVPVEASPRAAGTAGGLGGASLFTPPALPPPLAATPLPPVLPLAGLGTEGLLPGSAQLAGGGALAPGPWCQQAVAGTSGAYPLAAAPTGAAASRGQRGPQGPPTVVIHVARPLAAVQVPGPGQPQQLQQPAAAPATAWLLQQQAPPYALAVPLSAAAPAAMPPPATAPTPTPSTSTERGPAAASVGSAASADGESLPAGLSSLESSLDMLQSAQTDVQYTYVTQVRRCFGFELCLQIEVDHEKRGCQRACVCVWGGG